MLRPTAVTACTWPRSARSGVGACPAALVPAKGATVHSTTVVSEEPVSSRQLPPIGPDVGPEAAPPPAAPPASATHVIERECCSTTCSVRPASEETQSAPSHWPPLRTSTVRPESPPGMRSFLYFLYLILQVHIFFILFYSVQIIIFIFIIYK